MEYKSQMTATKIQATSRCAIKIKDNYYTVEATEEKSLTGNPDELDIDAEWEMLWEEVNGIVDGQCQEIIETFK